MNTEIVKFIKENGKQIKLADNTPVEFSDPNKIWYIHKGKINLSGAKSVNNKITGKVYYLSKFQEGEILIGCQQQGKSNFCFIVSPEEDTVIYEFSVSYTKRKIKKNNVLINRLVELIDNWVIKLFEITNNFSTNEKNNIDYYLDENIINVEKPESFLSTRKRLIWFNSNESENFLFCGHLTIENTGPVFFPVSKEAYIKLKEPVNLKSYKTLDIFDKSEFWNGLNLYIELILEKIQYEIKQQKRVTDEWLERKYKARNKEFFHTVGLAKTVLEDSHEEQIISKFKKSPDNLFNVCSLVAENLDIKLVFPPNLESCSDPIDEISRYSGIRYREIILDGKWYKNIGNNALIAFIEESNNPIAIIPKRNEIIAYDLKEGTSFEINKNSHEKIEKISYTLYKPLPNKKLKLKDLIKYSIIKNKRDIFRLINSGLLTTILALLVPIMTAILFDSIIPNAQSSQLIYIAFALLMAAVGGIFFEIVKSISVLRLRGIIDSNLQAALWDRLLEMPSEFFRKFTSGDLADRSLSITYIINILSGVIITSIIGGIFSVFNFFLLYYFSPKLALITSGLVIVYIITMYFLGKKQIIYEKKIQYHEGKNFGIILQLLTGITTLKISGTEIKAFIHWFKNYIISKEYSIAAEKNKNIQRIISSSFYIISLTIIYFSLIKLTTGITTGQFLAFNAALGAFILSMIGLSESIVYALEIIPYYDRMKPVFDELPESFGVKTAPEELKGNIELHNIIFRYNENAPLVLNNISFKIRKGEYIALVGPSGSGKSTIIRLLLGFNNLDSGTIIYDDQELKNIDLRLLRRQLGVVLQDGSLFGGDIFTNIIGSSPHLTLNDAWDAAEEAALDKDIESMPMGMFTIVSEDGGTLSGGQRQRLMIARALVHKPKILIFDEATSALDNRTQAIVTESLDKLQVTRIVVAHRLSTIKNADRIIYLEEGKILEEGNYNDLMLLKGRFYGLAQRQLE
ncbi:MAG: NHLP bacteriocin export ABC transporter permease/ATPase subunit [Bacteroidales bacterium]|nr:NHLP bacteriocin export ABC transporter permease/ATPase subunit [Bacteroidales bacterium]